MSVTAPTPTTGSNPAPPPRSRERIPQERNKVLVFGGMALAGFAFPFLIQAFLKGTDYISVISTANSIFVYILLALGLNIVVGYAGLLDLGYAAFFAIGAYTMAFLTSASSPLAGTPFHTNFWIALPISFLMAALFGVLLGAPTLGLKGDYLAIVTLGFGEIVPITFNNLTQLTGGDSGLSNLDQPPFPLVEFSPTNPIPWYTLSLIVVIFSIWMVRRLIDSRIGRAWQALREDEIAASAMGLDLVKTKLLAFGMGASFAGFAGAIYAGSINTANPSQFRFDVSIIVLAMVILGGMGNLWGVIVGALVIQLLDRLLIPSLLDTVGGAGQDIIKTNGKGDFFGQLLINISSSQTRLLIFGLLLVSMMLLRPEGLFPNSRRRMELHDGDENGSQRRLNKLQKWLTDTGIWTFRATDEKDLQPQLGLTDDPLEQAERSHNINYNPSVNESSDPDDDKDKR